MIRLVLIVAILATVASAAIGSTLMTVPSTPSEARAQMIADAYATGGASWSILGGITIVEKTGGCGAAGEPAERLAVAGKGDRLPTAACAVVAAN